MVFSYPTPASPPKDAFSPGSRLQAYPGQLFGPLRFSGPAQSQEKLEREVQKRRARVGLGLRFARQKDGGGVKHRYPKNGSLVNATKDENLRNPGSLILSHTLTWLGAQTLLHDHVPLGQEPSARVAGVFFYISRCAWENPGRWGLPHESMFWLTGVESCDSGGPGWHS